MHHVCEPPVWVCCVSNLCGVSHLYILQILATFGDVGGQLGLTCPPRLPAWLPWCLWPDQHCLRFVPLRPSGLVVLQNWAAAVCSTARARCTASKLGELRLPLHAGSAICVLSETSLCDMNGMMFSSGFHMTARRAWHQVGSLTCPAPSPDTSSGTFLAFLGAGWVESAVMKLLGMKESGLLRLASSIIRPS